MQSTNLFVKIVWLKKETFYHLTIDDARDLGNIDCQDRMIKSD
jgi:hypothetical protein